MMKIVFKRHILSLVVMLFCSIFSLVAQDLTGIWRGYFITESYDHYKFELQVKQKGNGVSGVSYSYLSTVFYGKATLTGSYIKAGKKALIQEIRTVELRMSNSSQACIMKCIFEYSRSGREEFLEGTYSSKFEKDGLITKKGENCGGGKVYLRKVTTSDFYIEPFLRGKIKTTPVIVNKPPLKTNPSGKTSSPPIVNKNPEKKDTAKTKKPVGLTKPPVKKDTVRIKPVSPPLVKSDTSSKKIRPVVVTPAPPVIRNRINELVKVLTVNDPSVIVKLFDNGEIDGDTISVYLDNKLVLSEKRLTASPLVLKFNMVDERDVHELTMVAENLGTIPPNTSLMIVEAGGQRFEVRITSTEQKNAVVRFRYQKGK